MGDTAKRKPKPKPMPVYLLLRMMIDPATGNKRAAFVAASAADASILAERKYKPNTKIRAELKQPRNSKFNGLVHGLGKVLTQNIERFSHLDSHGAVKALQLESGVCCDLQEYELPNVGTIVCKIPQSLSYDSMPEEQFQQFWAACCEYLIATDWPTLTHERLTEMAEFEGFKVAA
ncbi:hypothetical protein YSKK_13520 [Halopseudomonas aestusnigri]|nr:hypothetical protein YSKK_13520 [Halopseudomonas aestusnigri]